MTDEQSNDYQLVEESLAKIHLPKNVFYNPVQEFNRDLSICVINQFADDLSQESYTFPAVEKIHILEALAASGLRSVRMLQQIPRCGRLVANDLDPAATALIKHNVRMNEAASQIRRNLIVCDTDNDVTKNDDGGRRDASENDCVVFQASCSDANQLMMRAQLEQEKQKESRKLRAEQRRDDDGKNRHNKEKNEDEENDDDNQSAFSSFSASLSLSSSSTFHVIDLDPYGSAAPFLHAATGAIWACKTTASSTQTPANQQNRGGGGLLCVTCTDAAVLCGSASGTSLGKYGAVTHRGPFAHEQALRVLLAAIQSHASIQGRVIHPLLSLSVDFYVRVFVRVTANRGAVKRIGQRLGLCFTCEACHSYQIQPMAAPAKLRLGQSDRCAHCGGQLLISGPLWIDSLHDRDFLARLLARLASLKQSQSERTQSERSQSAGFNTLDRMIGMLTMAHEELPDCALYWTSRHLCRALNIVMPRFEAIRSGILNAGYRVSGSHCELDAIKSDIPAAKLWQMMRAYVTQHRPDRLDKLRNRMRVADAAVCGGGDDNDPTEDAEKKCEEKEEIGKPAKKRRRNKQGGGDVSHKLTAGDRILSSGIAELDRFDFTEHPEANPDSRKRSLIRHQMPPAPDWGPKSKAARTTGCTATETTSTATTRTATAPATNAKTSHKKEERDEMESSSNETQNSGFIS